MSKMRFKLNRAGVRELLKSPEMQAVLTDKANGIRNRAGDGYESDILSVRLVQTPWFMRIV